MNDLQEVTVCWQWWNECVKRLRICPWSKECQQMAMIAQKQLVIQQAYYWNEVKP